MKFSNIDYNKLKECVQNTLTKHGVTIKDIEKSANELKFSETRKLWDIYWLSGFSKINRESSDKYLDTHITTAMRKVFNDLK